MKLLPTGLHLYGNKIGKEKKSVLLELKWPGKSEKNGEKQLIWQHPIVIAFRASAMWPQVFKSWIALSTG